MNIRKIFSFIFCFPFIFNCIANTKTSFSIVGFFELPESGREVFNMNFGWKFYKGDISGASDKIFDGFSWQAVSLPHGSELLPL